MSWCQEFFLGLANKSVYRVKKNANHITLVYVHCMTSTFLMVTQKNANHITLVYVHCMTSTFLKLPQIFFVFFLPQSNFVLQQIFSIKFFLHAMFNFFVCVKSWILKNVFFLVSRFHFF